MEYRFYGAGQDIRFVNRQYEDLDTPEKLYEVFSRIWCRQTCAPRMADDWNEGNKTLGQCSITSFLVQDLIGGEVYGIKLKDGNYHCFNVIGQKAFDLTSEQFKEKLDYSSAVPQERKTHFAKEEKHQRYLLLKEKLKEIMEK